MRHGFYDSTCHRICCSHRFGGKTHVGYARIHDFRCLSPSSCENPGVPKNQGAPLDYKDTHTKRTRDSWKSTVLMDPSCQKIPKDSAITVKPKKLECGPSPNPKGLRRRKTSISRPTTVQFHTPRGSRIGSKGVELERFKRPETLRTTCPLKKGLSSV